MNIYVKTALFWCLEVLLRPGLTDASAIQMCLFKHLFAGLLQSRSCMFLFEVQQEYFFHNTPEGCGFDETNLLIPCVITPPFPGCAIPGTSLCWL